MREFVKVTAVLVLVAGSIVAALAWFDDRPSQVTWVLRIGSPVVSFLALALFLWLHLRRDRAPDYLGQLFGTYYDRGGFCFGIQATTERGVCVIHAFYQNRYDRPSVGRIALRPVRGFLRHRKFDLITMEVACGPGEFGVVHMPVPIPRECQGRRQKFEVGASVEYPQGKGKTLRFGDGMVIRHNTEFGSGFATALTVAGALGGSIVWTWPAYVALALPEGIATDLPRGCKPHTETLWTLGDHPWPNVGEVLARDRATGNLRGFQRSPS